MYHYSSVGELFKKIITAILLVLLLILILQVYFSYKYKKEKIDLVYKFDYQIINTLIKKEQEKLFSLGYLLSTDDNIKKYLVDKKRERLFSYLNDKWEVLNSKFNLSSLHIVDEKGNSVVSFIDYDWGEEKEYKSYNIINFRKDLRYVIKSKKPLNTIFICRYFTGIRSIIPIKNSNVLGAISIGKSIYKMLPFFKEYTNKDSILLLRKEKLKNCLRTGVFSIVETKYVNIKDFLAIGKTDPAFINALQNINNLNSRSIFLIKGMYYLFSFYGIKDFSGNEIGNIVIISNITDIYKSFYTSIAIILVIFMVVLFTLIFLLKSYRKRFEDKFNRIKDIIIKLSKRDFSVIDTNLSNLNNIRKMDDLDVLTFYLIELGDELREHFIKLDKEIKKYAIDAYTDPLTGALNRRSLGKISENLLEQVKIKNIPLSIILVDIDFFKKINDTYGHDIGDKVLKDFVETIKNIVSKRDYIIRFGGEEFLIILPGADKKKAVELAEKIRKIIENKKLEIDGKNIRYTISAGVAELTDEDKTIYDLIIRADKNLYRAKRTGRNKIIW